MAKIFITGSADGLGHLSAKVLIEQGHEVVLHARNPQRAKDALEKLPGAKGVLVADLSVIEETKELAAKVNELGAFDAIIHNAGVYRGSAQSIFAVNTIAPYILTCLITMPKRLIYLSSGLHTGGKVNLEKFKDHGAGITYSDTKLHVVMLAFAISRKFPDVFSNAVNPGWVPTNMGGKGAPDSLEMGYGTQTFLAVSKDAEAMVSGRYFFHQKSTTYNPMAGDANLQDKFLGRLEEITGVRLNAD